MKKEKEDWLAEATALRTRDSEMQVRSKWFFRGIRMFIVAASLRRFSKQSQSACVRRKSSKWYRQIYGIFNADKNRILKLENEKKENETRIHLIQDYTRQIEVLRKAEQVWWVIYGHSLVLY